MVTQWSQKGTQISHFGHNENIDFGSYLLYFGYIGPSGSRPENDDKIDLKNGSTLDSKSEKYVPNWISKWGRFSPGKSVNFDSDPRTAYRRPKEPKIGSKDPQGFEN